MTSPSLDACRVPAVLIDRTAHEALAWVLVATTPACPGHGTWRRAPFAVLSQRAGWQQVGDSAAAQRWSRAIRGLVDAGLLARRYAYVDAEAQTLPLYRTRRRGRTIELPTTVLDALTGPGRDAARLLWHWLAWRDADSMERPSANGVAERLGVARATVYETVRELATLGVLQLHHEPGHPYTIGFHPAPTAPAEDMDTDAEVGADADALAGVEALVAAGVLVADGDAGARARARARLWAWSQAHPGAPVSEGATHARMTPGAVEALLDEVGRIHPRHEPRPGDRYTDVDALAVVRAHVEATGNRRSASYRDAATAQGWVELDALLWRWGTWPRVLAAAGARVPETDHLPGQPIPAASLHAWVRAYLSEAEVPSLADMTAWMKQRGGPSRSTIRRRIGGWAQVMALLQPGDPAWGSATSPERAAEQRTKLLAWSHERPGVPIVEGARRVGVSVDVAVAMLGERARLHPRRYGRPRERTYTDEQLLQPVREHVEATGDHRVASYRDAARVQGWPSADTIIKRMGNWRAALAAAGVRAPDAGPTRGRAISDAQLRSWVAAYLADAPAPTWRDLEIWMRDHHGPSGSTIRTRCRTWAGVLALAEHTPPSPTTGQAD